MIARPITPDEVDEHLTHLARAELRCDPNHPPAPPDHLVRSQAEHGYVFVAEGGPEPVAYALLRDGAGEILWMTHIGTQYAAQAAALCRAVHETFGVDPWGVVHNDEVRGLIAQPGLHPNPIRPEHLTWKEQS